MQKTGVGRYTFELASALAQISQSPELVFFYGTHWSKHIKTTAVINANRRYGKIRNTGSRFVSADLKRWIRQTIFKIGILAYRADLFHATNYVAPAFDGTVIVTVHDLSFLRYPEAHPPERLAWLSKGLPDTLKRAGRIIVDSQFTKNELISLLDVQSERITVVYLGASQEYRPKDNDELSLKLKEFDLEPKGYILSVGTLEPRKNILSLLQAYELLPDSLKTRWPLVVVGMQEWKEQNISRHIEALTQSGNIRALGYIPDDKLTYVYAGAAIFIYPSLYEGFGLPPLEAMASGVPVIASNRSSLPEVVGDSGVLIDPEDIDSLAQAIDSLLNDREKHDRMVEKGLKQAKKFTWKECAENTFSVYRDVLRQS